MRKLVISSLSIAVLLSGCTEPGQTTAIGATAGGVLGAGLGAIVGNQTGDPGTGLVIGGLAGAGAGAAVGNALEGQQVAIRQQDEAIERQQKTIQAQNAELKELRRSAGDTGRVGSKNAASMSRGKASYSWSSSREEALARSRSEALAKSSRGTTTSPGVSSGSSFSEAKSAMRAPSENAQARSFRDQSLSTSDNRSFRRTVQGKAAAAERDALLQNESSLDSSVERRLSKAEASIDSRGSSAVKGGGSLQERTIGIREEPVAENDAAESTGVSTLSGNSHSTVECQQASEEEMNAGRATEPSQQLFHLRRALRLCPEDPRYHVALGKTYASMKRDEDASFEFREALRIDSSFAPALQSLEELNKKMQDSTQH